MNTAEQSTLGKATPQPQRYDPGLLFPISRVPQRAELGLAGALPFFGADFWTAYELSWLNPRGKPQVAIAHLTVPCETPHIIESKSLKLYLGSLAGERFATADEVAARIRADLTEALWRGSAVRASLGLRLVGPEAFGAQPMAELEGLSLDRLDIECPPRDRPAPELLVADRDAAPVEEVLVSQLLKSNCLVTGQPDWGSVQIRYSGAPIAQDGLLAYLISFRQHNEFHEPCVERIFMDLWRRCQPTRLAVYARYTRRGGLDINPWRTSHPGPAPAQARTARQ